MISSRFLAQTSRHGSCAGDCLHRVVSITHVAFMNPDPVPLPPVVTANGVRGAGLPPVRVTAAIETIAVLPEHTVKRYHGPSSGLALTLDPRPCAPGVRAVGAGGAGLQRFTHAGVVDPVGHRLCDEQRIVSSSELTRFE